MSDDCPICYCPPSLPVKIDCGHIFCYLCIKGTYLSNTYSPSCPMCRHPMDPKILEDMSIKDVLPQVLVPSNPPEPDIQWYYHSRSNGRNTGWWKYDIESNLSLEEMYQKHLTGPPIPVPSSSSSSSSDESSEDEEMLRVGYLKFKIDFTEMTQTNAQGFSRKIIRLQKGESLPPTVKGIAGLKK